MKDKWNSFFNSRAEIMVERLKSFDEFKHTKAELQEMLKSDKILSTAKGALFNFKNFDAWKIGIFDSEEADASMIRFEVHPKNKWYKTAKYFYIYQQGAKFGFMLTRNTTPLPTRKEDFIVLTQLLELDENDFQGMINEFQRIVACVVAAFAGAVKGFEICKHKCYYRFKKFPDPKGNMKWTCLDQLQWQAFIKRGKEPKVGKRKSHSAYRVQQVNKIRHMNKNFKAGPNPNRDPRKNPNYNPYKHIDKKKSYNGFEYKKKEAPAYKSFSEMYKDIGDDEAYKRAVEARKKDTTEFTSSTSNTAGTSTSAAPKKKYVIKIKKKPES